MFIFALIVGNWQGQNEPT